MTAVEEFENKFLEYIQDEMDQDLAHDINHLLRIVKTSTFLCKKEHALE